MKRSVSLVFVLASLFSFFAFAAEPGDRPIGVEAKDWIPVTANLGFVVVAITELAPGIQGPTSPQLLLNEVAPAAPAAGYFMIKSENGWRRLVVMTPADIAAAAKG